MNLLSKEELNALFAPMIEHDKLINSLNQVCTCNAFKQQIGVTIDSQDLFELKYTSCPYCKTPFPCKS